VSASRIVSIGGVRSAVDGLSSVEAQLIAAHEAVARGDAILAPYRPALLASLPRDPVTIITVLDIAEAARSLEQEGVARYSWARARSLGPLTVARLLPTGLRLGSQMLGSGIAGLGLMLVAAELRHVADHGFRAAALHWQLSDFLVATGDRGWLARYVSVARGYGLRAGLCSNDVGRALQLAGELRDFDFVIAPLSAAGFRMTPHQSACEAIIRRRRAEVIPHLGSLSTFDPADLAYAQGLGLDRFVVDG
jgi:hypothetical protein